MAAIALTVTIIVITTIAVLLLVCKSNEKLNQHMIGKSCVVINKLQYSAYVKKIAQTAVSAYVQDGILYVEAKNSCGPGYTQYNIYPNGRVTNPYENNTVLSKALNGKVFTI